MKIFLFKKGIIKGSSFLERKVNIDIKGFCTDEKIFHFRTFCKYQDDFFEINIDETRIAGDPEQTFTSTWGHINRIFNQIDIPDKFWPIRNRRHLKEIFMNLFPEELV